MEVRCRPAVVCFLVAALSSAGSRAPESSDVERQYLNEWAVEIPGGLAVAQAIAKELDYNLVRQVGGDPPPPPIRITTTASRCHLIIMSHTQERGGASGTKNGSSV